VEDARVADPGGHRSMADRVLHGPLGGMLTGQTGMDENPYKSPVEFQTASSNAPRPLVVGNLSPLAAILVFATVVGFTAVMAGFWLLGFLR
jgi:hypothetical protein